MTATSFFIREYSNYIECRCISESLYVDIEKITYVTETLDPNGQYKRALRIIQIQKNMYNEMLK